jgi:hypothetical protein
MGEEEFEEVCCAETTQMQPTGCRFELDKPSSVYIDSYSNQYND